ncbi:MAG: Ig-like domain-containing protein [Verrucomicrobiota bacterium]|nr:Ig-like domain-containing protein [Verrucomicrobiota bacterium]
MSKAITFVLLAGLLGFGWLAVADDGETPPTPPIPEPVVKPIVEILATDPTGLTDASTAAFTVVRAGPFDAALELKYTIAGTGENGVDYTGADGSPLTGAVEIPAGFAATDIVIVPKVNPANRGNKTVVLTIEANDNHVVGRHAKATVRLIDDVYNDNPPSVSLTVTGGTVGDDGVQVFELPATVKLTAEAKDTDDTVVKVSFYADDHFLGADTEAPFEFDWVNPRPGTYDLFARAVDQFGKSTLSGGVKIVVKATFPSVKITSPTEKSVPAGSDVKVAAEVTPGSGAIAKVEFYADNKLLKEFTEGPYEATLEDVRPGVHKIRVRVTDEFGLSATATFVFKAVNQPPVVVIVSPKSGDTFKAGSTVELAADVTDPDDNAIDHVTFYANGRAIATVKEPQDSKFTCKWENVPRGMYLVYASATDEFGARAVSKPAKITVTR